jgi:PKD repeat protein
VTPGGIDENSGKLISLDNITPKYCTVTQELKAHLEVTNIETFDMEGNPQTVFAINEEFTVEVTVKNTGGADALDVTATIDPGANCALGVGEAQTKTLGDIGGGNSRVVTWTLQCENAGKSTIVVTPAGVDENTNEPIPDANIESGSTTVMIPGQESRAYLVVEIVEPLEYRTFSTEQEFTVIAKVYNSGGAVALDVTPSLSIFPPSGAHVVDGPQPASVVIPRAG